MIYGHYVAFMYHNECANLFDGDPMWIKVIFPQIKQLSKTFQTMVDYPCGCRLIFNDEYLYECGRQPPVKIRNSNGYCPFCNKNLTNR